MTTPSRRLLVVMGLIALFSLWLRTGYPTNVIGSSPNDDFLFLRLAISLIKGRWLGPYDNLTLAKGAFFPIFIAASHALGLTLSTAEQLLYLAACFLTSLLVLKATRSQRAAGVGFLLLALNPVFWNGEVARVIREEIYISLSLALVVLAATLLRPGRLRSRGAWILPVVIGCAAAAFWLTREEGPWLAPALLTLGAFAWLDRRTDPALPRTSVAAARALPWRPIGLSALVALVLVGAVATENYRKYGLFTDVEFRSRGFVSAYGALSRIEHDHFERYVVFPRDARLRAYEASPATAELKPFFEGPQAENWRRVGCNQTNIEPCPEILSGWFMWALREAAAEAGHFTSARESNAYFRRIAAEINAACDAGRLRCLPARSSLRPPFRHEYVGDTLVRLPTLAKLLIQFSETPSAPYYSTGSPGRIALFKAMIGQAALPAPTELPFDVVGWVAAAQPPQSLTLINRRTNTMTPFILTPAPDVDATMKASGYRGFRFVQETDCRPEDCALRLVDAAGHEQTIEVASLKVGTAIDSDGLRLYIDTAGTSANWESAYRIDALRSAFVRTVAATIQLVYSVAMSVGSLVALAGLLAGLAFYRSKPQLRIMVSLCATSLVAVLTRGVLLAYLDATSIPSLNTLYLSPATPFLILFVTTGVWVLVRSLSRSSRSGVS